ncbi:hypothetical protein BdWA1_000700 [Babesia duncani]|uniref:Uncharacterized protein n=1 Tax=Babesia duncani TaxID=323732 RepID=A0AAD9UQA9_9APIC|nr:hypothetical protein BdWA1_000700 [Babesia duncani]
MLIAIKHRRFCTVELSAMIPVVFNVIVFTVLGNIAKTLNYALCVYVISKLRLRRLKYGLACGDAENVFLGFRKDNAVDLFLLCCILSYNSANIEWLGHYIDSGLNTFLFAVPAYELSRRTFDDDVCMHKHVDVKKKKTVTFSNKVDIRLIAARPLHSGSQFSRAIPFLKRVVPLTRLESRSKSLNSLIPPTRDTALILRFPVDSPRLLSKACSYSTGQAQVTNDIEDFINTCGDVAKTIVFDRNQVSRHIRMLLTKTCTIDELLESLCKGIQDSNVDAESKSHLVFDFCLVLYTLACAGVHILPKKLPIKSIGSILVDMVESILKGDACEPKNSYDKVLEGLGWLILAGCEFGPLAGLDFGLDDIYQKLQPLVMSNKIKNAKCLNAVSFYYSLMRKDAVDFSFYDNILVQVSNCETSLDVSDLFYAKLTNKFLSGDYKLSYAASSFLHCVILPNHVNIGNAIDLVPEDLENVEIQPFMIGPFCLHYSRMDSKVCFRTFEHFRKLCYYVKLKIILILYKSVFFDPMCYGGSRI